MLRLSVWTSTFWGNVVWMSIVYSKCECQKVVSYSLLQLWLKRHAMRGWFVFLVQSASGRQMTIGARQEQPPGWDHLGLLVSRTTAPRMWAMPYHRWLIVWLETGDWRRELASVRPPRRQTTLASLFCTHCSMLKVAAGALTEQNGIAVVQPGGDDAASHCLSEV